MVGTLRFAPPTIPHQHQAACDPIVLRYSALYSDAERSQLNDRAIALRRIESRRSFALKASKARRTPPRKDSADGCENRKPVSPSMMVSASPPVWWPIGSDPKRCAYIWLNPHGSNRDGISVKSLPAKMRL